MVVVNKRIYKIFIKFKVLVFFSFRLTTRIFLFKPSLLLKTQLAPSSP